MLLARELFHLLTKAELPSSVDVKKATDKLLTLPMSAVEWPIAGP